MRMIALARRYAGALFEVAKKEDAIDKIESDLGLLSYSLQTMPRLREAMAHPLLPPERKNELVTAIFGAEIQPVTLDFIHLLIDKRRAYIMDDIEREYVQLADDYRGVTPAVVTSAVPLSMDERKLLQHQLEEFTRKKVEIALEEDPGIIGGLIVRIGDTVIDGSVKGYLASLKNRLLGKE